MIGLYQDNVCHPDIPAFARILCPPLYSDSEFEYLDQSRGTLKS